MAMADDKPKRKKFIAPKVPRVPMRPGQETTFGVGMAHEKLVGRVAIEWARLEHMLNEILWSCLQLSFEDGRTLTGRADTTTRIALLRTIAPRHLTNEDKLEALLVALDTIDAVRDDRNFIVHGSWGRIWPEGTPIAASFRAKSKPDEVSCTRFG